MESGGQCSVRPVESIHCESCRAFRIGLRLPPKAIMSVGTKRMHLDQLSRLNDPKPTALFLRLIELQVFPDFRPQMMLARRFQLFAANGCVFAAKR